MSPLRARSGSSTGAAHFNGGQTAARSAGDALFQPTERKDHGQPGTTLTCILPLQPAGRVHQLCACTGTGTGTRWSQPSTSPKRHKPTHFFHASPAEQYTCSFVQEESLAHPSKHPPLPLPPPSRCRTAKHVPAGLSTYPQCPGASQPHFRAARG